MKWKDVRGGSEGRMLWVGKLKLQGWQSPREGGPPAVSALSEVEIFRFRELAWQPTELYFNCNQYVVSTLYTRPSS